MGEIQALRGMQDILPQEIGYWQQIEATARDIFAKAVYQEIRPPVIEQTELFERGIGEATDVVGKEMYTFRDRGDRSISLRPELTAGVVRAFIQHNFGAGVHRLWYAGSVFRYERPGAGRQRQFYQIGVENIGTQDPRADVEVIAIAIQLFQDLGLKSLTLDLNSVGRGEDRQRYRDALVSFLSPYKDELDRDSQDRLDRNPLRILDSKDKRTQEIIKDAPSLLDYLGDESRQHFDRVQQMLSDLEIAYRLNPFLVRGLDYYTHTAFEIKAESLGNESTVCGGGRYDGLVSELGGKETPAVGWALGMERLVLLVTQLEREQKRPLDFYLVSRGDRAEAQALVLAQKLRYFGFSVELDLSGAAFGKQFKRADRSKATACLTIGDAEAENQTVNLKWMATQEQEAIAQTQLLAMTDTLKEKMKR